MTETMHPQWDVVFEIFFEHGRNKNNARDYIDRFKEDPALQGSKQDDRKERLYFAYAESALRFGPYTDWERDIEDKARWGTEKFTTMPFADRMSQKMYDQCWKALQGWCQTTDAWQRQRQHMNEYLKKLLEQVHSQGLPSGVGSMSHALGINVHRPKTRRWLPVLIPHSSRSVRLRLLAMVSITLLGAVGATSYVVSLSPDPPMR